MALEQPPGHQQERLGGDPAAPVLLPEPVPDLGGEAFHVVAATEPDPSCRLSVHVDGQILRYVAVGADAGQERLRIRRGVRVRKPVPQVPCDREVVGLPHERLRVSFPPTPHHASSAAQFHHQNSARPSTRNQRSASR